jgi:hypothetical protein
MSSPRARPSASANVTGFPTLAMIVCTNSAFRASIAFACVDSNSARWCAGVARTFGNAACAAAIAAVDQRRVAHAARARFLRP